MADSPLITLSSAMRVQECLAALKPKTSTSTIQQLWSKSKVRPTGYQWPILCNSWDCKKFNHKTLFFCLKTVFIMSSAISHSIILSWMLSFSLLDYKLFEVNDHVFTFCIPMVSIYSRNRVHTKYIPIKLPSQQLA